MPNIPESATAYITRLVDSRKRAYAQDCLACWNQGQPFASEWPNLKAEYVQDVATKMRRYLKVKPQSTPAVKPEPVAVPLVGDEPQVMTYNDYCYINGVAGHALDDADHGTYKFPNGISEAAKRRILKRSIANTEQWLADRARLKAEYDAKVANGEFRAPTSAESLERTAAGHPDNESVQAARRVIAKRAARRAAMAEAAPSPVAEWVEAVTNPEPAKPNPQQTGRPEIIICPECSQAIRTSEIVNGKCPNPACFVGQAAYHAAHRAWSQARDIYAKAAREAGKPYATDTWRTRNTEPQPDHFKNGQQPKYSEWEKPRFESKADREARLEAEKWANPTIITRKHGTSRILASVPEQQRLKLEAEIIKADTSRIPDHRTYLRGKAYIGPVRGSVYDGRLVFTETLGGEKWAGAFARMFEVAGIVGWNKKDGAKPGDYIPATPAEARHIQAVAGSTFAEAAG